MSILDVLKEIFGKNEETIMKIEELKSLFASDNLNNAAVILSGVSQIINFIDKNIADASKRSEAIDAVIDLLQAEK